ncbi:hypothetical protein KVU_2465 [Ketogulonicigenium vulgare WSH-001]|uniref:Uncharacterized protein n=1 Tax=Ketogulonicigenium vulgare (strain WSH-001) TaxID=759362 RepID=F9Y7K9_KETVW|nr:hypothetical protein KVU_2465 [Ketogulonicigenium vulgare WSH-001]
MRNRLGRVQAFWTSLGAVHDRMAAIQLERIFQLIQTLARRLVAAVDDPAIGMQQGRRPQIAIRVPPIAGTSGRARGAHHAFIKTVQLFAILDRLAPFFLRCIGLGFQPRHNAGMLGIEMRQIRYQILDHRHMRQRIDADIAADFVQAIDAGQSILPVDIHRARAADPLAAGPAEGQGRVDLVLDLDQNVQHHRAALIQIDEIGVEARVRAIIGRPAIYLHLAHVLCACGLGPCFANRHPAVLGQCQLDHVPSPYPWLSLGVPLSLRRSRNSARPDG